MHCSDVIQRDVVDVAIAENWDGVVFQYPLIALVDHFSCAYFELVIHLLNRQRCIVTELTGKCSRRLKTDHLCRMKIDQGLLLA